MTREGAVSDELELPERRELTKSYVSGNNLFAFASTCPPKGGLGPGRLRRLSRSIPISSIAFSITRSCVVALLVAGAADTETSALKDLCRLALIEVAAVGSKTLHRFEPAAKTCAPYRSVKRCFAR